MTRGTLWLDLDQNRVVIAIQADVHDLLRIAGRFPFVPKPFSASAPEPRFFSLEGALSRLLVHIGDRQNLTRPRVLNDGGDQPVRAELRSLKNVAHRTTTPRSRKYDFTSWIVTSRK